MENVPLIKKLEVIFNSLKNETATKYVLPIIIGIGIITLIISLLNRKYFAKIYVFIYLTIIAMFGYLYSEQLLSFVDYLIECIVDNILFPNLTIYATIIIAANIIIIKTIIDKRIRPYIRNINVVGFTMMQILIFLIVNNIIDNKINIYEKLSIYTNQELLILIQFSMIVFVIWMIVLLIIRTIDLIFYRDIKINIKKKSYNNNLVVTNVYDNENKIKEIESTFIEYIPIKKKKYS